MLKLSKLFQITSMKSLLHYLKMSWINKNQKTLQDQIYINQFSLKKDMIRQNTMMKIFRKKNLEVQIQIMGNPENLDNLKRLTFLENLKMVHLLLFLLKIKLRLIQASHLLIRNKLKNSKIRLEMMHLMKKREISTIKIKLKVQWPNTTQ